MDQPLSHARYSFVDSLGEGGQANTYRGRDGESGREVAIKVLTLRGSEWKRFDLFERECDVLRGLDHAGIPNFLDTFADEERGKYALVMELVEGESLAALLARKRVFSEQQLWRLLAEALEILHYLHSRLPPVIHRDIKPANLILDEAGSLHLVDFGGVRVALRPEGGSTVVGTFGYMAPEQLHGEALPATDIYGLGATFAALTCGMEADKLPRKGLKIDLGKLLTAGPLHDVLDGMLEPDPSERLLDVASVRAAIERARQGASVALATSAADAPADPSTSYPPTDKDSAATMVLGMLGTLGYVGLLAVEVVLWPLIFTLLSLGFSRRPERLNRLQRASDRLRKRLERGRAAMKTLAEGKRHEAPRRALPPRGAPRGRLPPPRSTPPPPEGRGWRGRRHGPRPRRHGRRRNR